MVNARLDVLTDILDIATQASLYSFTKGTEFDQSYALTGATTAVQGRDYGYDALGSNAAPVAPRKTAWKFIHIYGVGESYTTLKDAMTLAFGHGRPIYLQKVRPDGVVLIAQARLDSFPDRATIDTKILAEFDVSFTQLEDWAGKDIASPRYDTGLHYDSGQRYDQRGLLFPLTGSLTSFSVVSTGTVTERDSIVRFDGPITGPITLVNGTCDVRGIPFPPGTTDVTTRLTTTIFLSLASGQYFLINCRTNTIASNVPGIVPWSVITKAPGQHAYFLLVPGTNQIGVVKIDGAAAGDVYIESRSRYRS